jgi:tetratricopeptide (TPR) repeat protein
MRFVSGLLAATLALVLLAEPALARTLTYGVLKVGEPVDQSQSQKLDTLFQDLQTAKSVDDGRAIEQMIVAIWLQSGDPEVDKLMSWTLSAMGIGAYTLALNYLDQIVVLKPDYAEGWNKRATVYYLTHQFDQSVADIDKTLALEPRHFGALAGLGLIKQAEGDQEGALAAFKRALAVNPNLEDVQNAVYRLESELRRKQI